MKRIIAICILALPLFSIAQEPVSWNTTVKKLENEIYEIHFRAALQLPWHVYSQKTPSGGPVATEFRFNKNPLAVFAGPVRENGVLIKKHEQVFGLDVLFYNNEVDFVQTVKLRGKVKTNIKGSFTYMVCNDKQCSPPREILFDLPIQ